MCDSEQAVHVPLSAEEGTKRVTTSAQDPDDMSEMTNNLHQPLGRALIIIIIKIYVVINQKEDYSF